MKACWFPVERRNRCVALTSEQHRLCTNPRHQMDVSSLPFGNLSQDFKYL